MSGREERSGQQLGSDRTDPGRTDPALPVSAGGQALEQLLLQLLPLDAEHREARLLQALGEDAEALALARQRLQQLDEITLPLVGADAVGAGDTLPALAAAALRALAAELPAAAGRVEAAGDLIGPWQLLRPLGRGGMGTVWLAQRNDGQFQRIVALKLISAGQDSAAIVQRFLRERQILASLNHPNIAKLLDGGVAPDGRPYFVLEHVDGLPITSYCDRHHLRVVERIRLFLQVCRAVQHAHQRLVVHRDLKPSNILVTGERMVQLLDFGIAKLLHPDLHGLPELTRPEDQAMTPRYAAPEQIRNESITTATDIYALGVLLYELLTGSLPYPVQSQAGHALERAILETEPRRPVATLTDPANQQRELLARQRGSGLDELTHALEGDLETVLLKALKKQPVERYASVEALAKDLEAWLDGRPVSARPDTWRYRVGKFAARHRVAVAASALALCALLATTALSLQQAHQAQLQAARASAVGDFLVGLFEAVDPAREAARELRARDLLDLGARRIDDELHDDPDLQARLNSLVGRLLLASGDAEAGLQRLRSAIGSGRLDDAAAYKARIDSVACLLSLQRLDQAEEELQALQALPPPSLAAQTLLAEKRVEWLLLNGQLDQARQLAAEALDERQADPITQARLHALQARIEEMRGDFAAAETQVQAGIELLQHAGSGAALEHAALLERAANIKRLLADPAQAQALVARARSQLATRVADDHPLSLALRRQDADLLEELGRYDEARAMLEAVVVDAERRYGRSHLSRAVALNSLAAIDFRLRDLDSAALRMQEVAAIYRSVHGDEHPDLATVLNNLANVQRERGQLAAAESALLEAMQIRERTAGTHSYEYGIALLGLGRLQVLKGQSAEAAVAYRQAAECFLGSVGAGHPETLGAQVRLAHALLDGADYAAAQQVLAALGQPDSPEIGPEIARHRGVQAMWAWARARLAQAHDDPSAAQHYQQALESARELPQADVRRVGIILDARRWQQAQSATPTPPALADLTLPDPLPAGLEPRLRER